MERVKENGREDKVNEIAILQIQGWADFPLSVTHFVAASLSPFFETLLLHSEEQNLMLMPLWKSSSSASASSQVEDSFKTPGTTFPLKSQSDTFSSPLVASSTERPSFETPYFTPFSTLDRVESPANESMPSSTSLQFPYISEVSSFSWGCLSDGYGANRRSNFFKELLFTVGKEGLAIHGFTWKTQQSDGLPNISSKEEADKVGDSISEDQSHSYGKSNKGYWRNWGVFGLAGSGIHTACKTNQSTEQSSRYREDAYDPGKRKFRTSNEDEIDWPPDGENIDNRMHHASNGLVTFVLDAVLEQSRDGLELRFPEPQVWPSSAEIVSLVMPYESASFSSLMLFVDGEARAKDSNLLPSLQGSSEAGDSVSLEARANSRAEDNTAYKFTKLFSNPDNNQIGFVLSVESHLSRKEAPMRFKETDVPEKIDRDANLEQKPTPDGIEATSMFTVGEMDEGPHLTQRNHSERGDGKVIHCKEERVVQEAFVLIATINTWGLRWISSVSLCDQVCNIPLHEAWVDFALAGNRLLGLKHDGKILLWSALCGKSLTCIDVMAQCGLKNVGGPKNCDLKLTSEGQNNVVSEHGKYIQNSFQFAKLVVSETSMLAAASDKQGHAFLVSLNDVSPKPGNFKTKSHKRIVPSWEIGGSDVGISKVADFRTQSSWLVSFSGERDSQNWEFSPEGSLNTLGLRMPRENHSDNRRETDYGASVFTTRVLSRPSSRRRFAQNYKPASEIYFSPEPSCSGNHVALNPLGLTRLFYLEESGRAVVVQDMLHNTDSTFDGGGVDTADGYKDLFLSRKHATVNGEVLAFSHQGLLYLVLKTGLQVVLPPVAIHSAYTRFEDVGLQVRWWRTGAVGETLSNFCGSLIPPMHMGERFDLWKVEVLDRALIYDGLEEAEHLCLQNGWSLQYAKLRMLQLSLHYLQADELERGLENLVHVGASEAGVVRVLFATVEHMLNRFGSDNELAHASRLLALVARFITGLIRKLGMEEWHQRRQWNEQTQAIVVLGSPIYQQPVFPQNTRKISKSLSELSRFLEVTRSLQDHLHAKRKRPKQEKGGYGGDDGLQRYKKLLVYADESAESTSLGPAIFPNIDAGVDIEAAADRAYHAKSPSGSIVPGVSLWPGSSWELGMGGVIEDVQGRKISPQESPREMLIRWETQNVDIAAIVRDALRAGRVPLAVVQLHRMRRKGLSDEFPENQAEIDDVFKEVQQVGRSIIYNLLIKGKIAIALAALRRLGEDIEVSLRELAFGTVRRSLRQQAAKELRRHCHLAPRELEILEIITLLEKAYPSSSFSNMYGARQRLLVDHPSVDAQQGSEDAAKLCIQLQGGLEIECGDVDGVVLGSWCKLSDNQFLDEPPAKQENAAAGYWAAAAVWLSAWDKQTIDRMLLEQKFLVEERSWEARMEYSIAHQQWKDVSALLDDIPSHILQEQKLHVRLDCKDSYDRFVFGATGSHTLLENPRNGSSGLEVDAVDVIIPKVKILAFKLGPICTSWMRKNIEEKLVKNFIFLRRYWVGTTELMSLFARTGLLFERQLNRAHDAKTREGEVSRSRGNRGQDLSRETIRAVHELVLQHCVRHHAPQFLQLYLDHHGLALDRFSASHMLALTGDFQWARWLLLSRLKGREYDASFANARTILAPGATLGGNLQSPDMENFIPTIDDLAEAAGEIVALATMMHAPVPVQKCLCTGSISRHMGASWQCTLENLEPGLQKFPTLWQSLFASCFGHERRGNSSTVAIRDLASRTDLAAYMQWRDSLFSSGSGDTSLLLMLPQRVPRGVRRLLQISIQGPIGGGQATDAILWEAAISKSIEEELYAHSSEDAEVGVERHLRRGRAMAAFDCLLGLRGRQVVGPRRTGSQLKSSRGQVYSSSEVQALLSPLTMEEERMLVSVMPLAVTNFENMVVVSACACFLELCGLSANMLHIDVAVLRRIADFYKAAESNALSSAGVPSSSENTRLGHRESIAISLAQSLADEYIKEGTDIFSTKAKLHAKKIITAVVPNKVFVAILQNLEKASLREDITRKGDSTSGSWLSTGAGDGAQLRSLQRATSEQWSLVTSFCRVHQLPLSTTYLSVLAKDNDWVGFLAEAQIEACPLNQLMKVASEEFSDIRVKSHVLTVLRSLPTASQQSPIINSNAHSKLSINQAVSVPAELFTLLAEFEHQKNPGKTLLAKAKDLRWPLLAIVASCFLDVTPFSCLTVWLEITAARHTSSIRVNDEAAQVAISVGAAVEATNALPPNSRAISVRYNRKNAKRCRRMLSEGSNGSSHAYTLDDGAVASDSTAASAVSPILTNPMKMSDQEQTGKQFLDDPSNLAAASNEQQSVTRMLAVLCEQGWFLPLLRAFELFTPASSLLPFLRFLQAFSQMRLSEASAHLTSFSVLLKDEMHHMQFPQPRSGRSITTWITAAAVTAADTVLATCPSAYERRCLLQLLATADFGDGGSAAIRYKRLCRKVELAEPSLQQGSEVLVDGSALEDEALLTALEGRGMWEEARSWAQQLDLRGQLSASFVHHVTAAQAEALVAEWKELLWDVPEERAALWGHCQVLFTRHTFPPVLAGMFFLRHAEEVEHEIAPAELHAILLLALRWLSGSMTNSSPLYPLQSLRELETRIWLLAVKSELSMRDENAKVHATTIQSTLVQGFTPDGVAAFPSNVLNPVDQTAIAISGVDNHLQKAQTHQEDGHLDESKDSGRGPILTTRMGPGHENNASPKHETLKFKRRLKGHGQYKRIYLDVADGDSEGSPQKVAESGIVIPGEHEPIIEHDESVSKQEQSVINWEERVGKNEVEQAILALLEVGQISAAKQLQQKLVSTYVPIELLMAETAQNIALLSCPLSKGVVTSSMLPSPVLEHLKSVGLLKDLSSVSPLEILEIITGACREDCGRGFCNRVMVASQIANFLEVPFPEAFQKQPTELLQLLALKGQDALAEAKLLVSSHVIDAANIARILAESFLKGLFAAYRGGYMNSSQREEGPAPLLWRSSDFLQWAQLCPSEPELGHALMRLVISGHHDMPYACEVELIILAHHFYESSACLDGMDVLVALAATRVESYVAEGEFSALARLVTGVSNFQTLRFVLDLLIENGQLELLLRKRDGVDATKESLASIRGFRMAVLSALKHFNPYDLDAFAMVFSHFKLAHEMAALLESRARKGMLQYWVARHESDQNEELLEIMRFFVEASEVYGGIDCGNRTRWCCAQASLISLQLRMPEGTWLNLTETNARRLLVEQRRFQEALIIAEAYGLNQPAEWVPVLWNQMSSPGWIEQFLSEFVISLPLPGNMLMELARFYRAEVTARGDQLNFSKWLTPGGMPSEFPRYLGKSFRSILKHVHDIRLRIQLATVATGFPDVVDACMCTLDKVPDTAGPLILKKGHGGTYVPLM